MKKFHLVIISGLSGAGKSAVIKCFEDIGFFCVDNLPPPLIPKFVELCLSPGSEVSRVALGLDIRNRDFLNAFHGIYESLCKEGYPVELLFIEAEDEVLIRRFSESRRPHPLGRGRAVSEGIAEERKKLSDLRDLAHHIIDTSELSPSELKKTIERTYVKKGEGSPLHISLVSFGFKFGVPSDLDMLFDVRFLKNPYFERALRFQTGDDKPVQDFVYAQKESEIFMTKLVDILDFLVPLYEHEGKSYLTLGIGCTGGKHRSVSIVNLLNEVLKQKGREISARHRDIHRPPTA
jgi:UPF0042 nucleotide-binding protein